MLPGHLFRAALLVGAVAGCAAAAAPTPVPAAPVTVEVLRDCPLAYAPDSAAARRVRGVTFEDGGRTARAAVTLPDLAGPHRITALVTVRPVPRSDREVFDRYDRAGSVRLVGDGGPDLELARFITPYGERADHEVDVTPLAPLLRGPRRSTSPTPSTGSRCPPATAPRSRSHPASRASCFGTARPATAPTEPMPTSSSRRRTWSPWTARWSRGSIPGATIAAASATAIPTARWTDGSWSSDYSRSGWCPGDAVLPVEFDLTDRLTPGRHTIRFAVEEMRPRDEKGNFGYWRISAQLVGWSRPPALWRND